MRAPTQGGYWPDWGLFGDAMVVGLLLAAVLPLLGVVLVLRQQTFVAAAIGQSANLGIAVTVWLAAWLGDGHGHAEGLAPFGAGVAAVVTAGLAMRALSTQNSTLEARSAFWFVVGGSAAMLLLAPLPHGQHTVQRLFLSSLLAVQPHDVWLAAGAALAVGVGWGRLPRRLLLWATDPKTAAAHGLGVARWDWLVGAATGLVLGHAIFTAGLLFSFGTTILPVLVARELASSLRGVVFAAPLLGVVAQVAAFSIAHRLDLPPGQTAVVVQGAMVVLAMALARGRR